MFALISILVSMFAIVGRTAEESFRATELHLPISGKPGFTAMDSALTHIAFTNVLAKARHLTNQILMNGSGIAAGDVDGDGRCDLYLCALDGPNVLYRNLGDWKFQDITAKAGVACPNMDATGAAFADLDGDGDLDLIVNTIGPGTQVFINDGKGKFSQIARLNLNRGGMSLSLADIDGDGFLDLYVANYRTLGLMDMPQTKFWLKNIGGKQVVSTVNGRPVTDPDLTNRFMINSQGGVNELGEPDVLYRNEGGTNFAAVSWTDGSFLDDQGQPLQKPPFEWGLSVMLRDLNGDRLPDIWVCNDFDSPDRIWINQGNGKFRALPRLPLRKLSLFSMGVDVADINRDGYDDIFAMDMLSSHHSIRLTQLPDRAPAIPVPGVFDNRPQFTMNTLFLNRGDGTYAEIANLAGLAATEWSWTPLFLDVDLDGWEDLLVSNGHERDARHMDIMNELRRLRTEREMTPDEILQTRARIPRLASSNLAFRNQHDLTFADVSREWGFGTPTVSHGMALADLDNDGDLDLIVNNLNDPIGIYRNDSPAPRVAVKLKGKAPNTRGIGARIKVTGGPVSQSQNMICGGRYLASDDAIRTFAAGSISDRLEIEVLWPSGTHTVVKNARPNCLYEIAEVQAGGAAREDARHAGPEEKTLFEDVSNLLAHQHHEESFDDFQNQPSLDKKLSQLGPGLAWADFDGDGWEDLMIGSGKGGSIALLRNNSKGGFVRVEDLMGGTLPDDSTALVGWRKSPTDFQLLAGIGNYEAANGQSAIRIFTPVAKGSVDMTMGLTSTLGPLAMADVDGDGNLDLFVGSRCVPGKYPTSDSSLLLRSVNGQFDLDAANTKQLAACGMVSGAVFSDLSGDGTPDLVLACEWGPLRVFLNEKGKLREATTELGLAKYTGWWNGVATGDFDGDGRPDIIASNWGRNTPWEKRRTQPVKLFYGDIDDVGKTDLLFATYDQELNSLAPERMLDFLGRSIRFIAERWTSHGAFAKATLQEILGDRMGRLQSVEAASFESMLFLNRSNRFEPHPLPVEAQMAPAFAVCVSDFDGDGKDDVFLSQNFFASQPDVPRYDAGRGLLLKGDGKGGFAPMPGQESGLKIYGEQRGAAACDYDHDGRVDLVVSQNGAETKLYRNRVAVSGLRVRLVGPKENPDAVGAMVRASTGAGLGPEREIQAGSGYWSQNGAAQVFPSQTRKIAVRWPGKDSFVETLVPADAKEIQIDVTGVVKTVK
jgi:enediyne biosynthesis protein E4